MLELGKYAGAMLSAWGITLALLALLMAVSLGAVARRAGRKHDDDRSAARGREGKCR